jgi:hypothetical protein
MFLGLGAIIGFGAIVGFGPFGKGFGLVVVVWGSSFLRFNWNKPEVRELEGKAKGEGKNGLRN